MADSEVETIEAPEVVAVQTKMVGEHRVFFFICNGCQKKRQSYKKTIAKIGICRVCKRSKVPENQLTLFERIFGAKKQG